MADWLADNSTQAIAQNHVDCVIAARAVSLLSCPGLNSLESCSKTNDASWSAWSAVFHRVLQLTNVDKCSCAAGDWHSTRQALFHGESVKPMTVKAILASIR